MASENSQKSARVFFALWPSANERAALAAWQPPLQGLCGGKAMRAENLHVTLVFLGEVAPDRLEALKLGAQEVEGRRFGLTFDVAQYWGHNHIVHAAPSLIPPQLAQLVHDLEHSLARHRFDFDKRPEYQPHITLLRHARWNGMPLPQMREARWHAERFVLAHSVSGSEGTAYQVLETFPLR